MSDGNDIERRMQDLASEPVPPADPVFVDRLDAHLRVVHVDELQGTGSRPMWIPAVLGSAAVVVMVAVGALVLTRSPGTTVVLMAASNTDVILPGDEAIAASAGLRLPDGTRIVVGDGGEAVVNGVVLGPGSEATVVSGQIDIIVTMPDEATPPDGHKSEPLVIDDEDGGLNDRSVTTTASDASPASTRSPAGTDGPTGNDRRESDRDAGDGIDGDGNSSADGDDGVTASTAPGERSSTSSATTVAATSTIRPDPTTTSTARTTSSTTTDRRAAPLELTVTPVNRDRLRLDWTLNRDIVHAGWRVRIRRGDSLSTVVAIRDSDARMITLEHFTPARGAVWIEALDRQGRVLLASDPVEIAD